MGACLITESTKMRTCTSCTWTFLCCFFLTLVMFVRATVPTLEELSTALFDSESFNLSHLTVDSETGRLYVGAVNRLYELSPALDRLREVVTGPYPDNPMCPPPPEPCRCTVISCRTDRLPISGVTKTLLIDYNARQLIHCTNLFQVNRLHLYDYSWSRNCAIRSVATEMFKTSIVSVHLSCPTGSGHRRNFQSISSGQVGSCVRLQSKLQYRA